MCEKEECGAQFAGDGVRGGAAEQISGTRVARKRSVMCEKEECGAQFAGDGANNN